jgi:hypothetical protein
LLVQFLEMLFGIDYILILEHWPSRHSCSAKREQVLVSIFEPIFELGCYLSWKQVFPYYFLPTAQRYY